MRRRTLLRRAIMRQQREDKGKQERAEISHPRAKLRRWSRGSEKQRSAEFAVARRLWFCRAAKREGRLRECFPGRRALVEGCAMALQRDQAGQGERKDTSGMEAWGGGAHLRRVRVEFPSERASESFLGPRRCCGGGLQGLGRSVAVASRRRRCSVWRSSAERWGGGALGLSGGCGGG